MERNRQPNACRQMSVVEAAWIGAMLEAEGCCIWYDNNGSRTVRATIVNTDPEIMSACLRLTQTGRVTGLLRERHRLCFHWNLNPWNSVQSFLGQVAPYSMKAQVALKEMDNRA